MKKVNPLKLSFYEGVELVTDVLIFCGGFIVGFIAGHYLI